MSVGRIAIVGGAPIGKSLAESLSGQYEIEDRETEPVQPRDRKITPKRQTGAAAIKRASRKAKRRKK